jgi:type I restriction enzyme S subunit
MTAVNGRNGWVTKPLIEVATLQRGYDLPVQDRSDGQYPIFAANGPIGFHGSAKCKGPGVVTGRSGTIGKVHFVEGDYWPLNTSLYVTDFHGNHPRWVYYMLQSFGLERFSQGAGVPTLNRNLIHTEPISVPPLPEQRRIAAILDKANAVRSKRREALAHFDRLAQSIFVAMFGDPLTNPKGWQTLPLTEACHCYSGGTPSKANSEYWSGNLPWFSPKDLKRDDLLNSEDHINVEVPNWTSLRLLPADTVVIVVRGMILAHTFPVSVLRVPATINQDLKALLPNVPLRPQFLANCLRAQSSSILERVSEAGHGTKRLDSERLRGINILLPSISSQDEFEDRVQVLKELQASSTKSHARLNSLFISLQHRAFRGEL